MTDVFIERGERSTQRSELGAVVVDTSRSGCVGHTGKVRDERGEGRIGLDEHQDSDAALVASCQRVGIGCQQVEVGLAVEVRVDREHIVGTFGCGPNPATS